MLAGYPAYGVLKEFDEVKWLRSVQKQLHMFLKKYFEFGVLWDKTIQTYPEMFQLRPWCNCEEFSRLLLEVESLQHGRTPKVDYELDRYISSELMNLSLIHILTEVVSKGKLAEIECEIDAKISDTSL